MRDKNEILLSKIEWFLITVMNFQLGGWMVMAAIDSKTKIELIRAK